MPFRRSLCRVGLRMLFKQGAACAFLRSCSSYGSFRRLQPGKV
jgi:hypothetical protein